MFLFDEKSQIPQKLAQTQDFDPAVVTNLYRQGGMKSLDRMIELFKEAAPLHLKEVEDGDALHALEALQTSAFRLGAKALQQVCTAMIEEARPHRKNLSKAQIDHLSSKILQTMQYLDKKRASL